MTINNARLTSFAFRLFLPSKFTMYALSIISYTEEPNLGFSWSECESVAWMFLAFTIVLLFYASLMNGTAEKQEYLSQVQQTHRKLYDIQYHRMTILQVCRASFYQFPRPCSIRVYVNSTNQTTHRIFKQLNIIKQWFFSTVRFRWIDRRAARTQFRTTTFIVIVLSRSPL